jgi:hypothetical protein
MVGTQEILECNGGAIKVLKSLKNALKPHGSLGKTAEVF